MKKLNYTKTVENIQNIMKDYIIKANLKSLVIGISGGIDSALVAVLVKPVCDELGIPLIGRSITIGTNSPEEIARAKAIGDLFCTNFAEIELTKYYKHIEDFDVMENGDREDEKSHKIRLGNFKARMRMMYLYNIASNTKGLVLSTDNMTELLLGFWTLHGDVGDFGLIQELWKTEVYDLSEWLSKQFNDTEKETAIMDCVNGDATDGLGITSTDLDQILPDWKNRHTTTRSGYSEVDEILINYFNLAETLINTNMSVNEHIKVSNEILNIREHDVIKRHFNSQFKRENPYNINRDDYVVY